MHDINIMNGRVPDSILEMNEDLVEILGRANFACARIAACLRKSGVTIKEKAEYEQAYVIHFLLKMYFAHGTDWAVRASEYLVAIARGVIAPNTETQDQENQAALPGTFPGLAQAAQGLKSLTTRKE